MKKAGAFPAKGAVVELGGTFDLSGATLALDAEDSGLSAGAPVVYRAARSGALLVGGHLLPAGGFRKVTDAATRARLPDGARDKVVAFDVKTVGLTSLPPLPDKFSGWGEMEVFSGGKAMRLAHWPNSGWAEIAGVIDRGVRPVDKADHESFPQTDEGRKRADFRPEVLEDIADPDVNRFKVQTGSEFRKLAPWFKRIPLEKIGLNR